MALPTPDFTEADVHAIRALLGGQATSEQQLRAMRFIAEDICHVFDSPYVSEGADRESFVMMGRHQVGVLITSVRTNRVLQEARERDYARANPETMRPVPNLLEPVVRKSRTPRNKRQS